MIFDFLSSNLNKLINVLSLLRSRLLKFVMHNSFKLLGKRNKDNLDVSVTYKCSKCSNFSKSREKLMFFSKISFLMLRL